MLPKQQKGVKTSCTAKKPLWILCGAVFVLVAAYLLFCWWAGGHALPNSEVAGASLGGTSLSRLEQRLEKVAERCEEQTVTLVCGGRQVDCPIDLAGVSFDVEEIRTQITLNQPNFLLRGVSWLAALKEQRVLDEQVLTFTSPEHVADVVGQLQALLDENTLGSSLAIEDMVLHVTKGARGLSIDTATAEQALRRYLAKGNRGELRLTAEELEPDELDFDALLEQVQVEPVNAALDVESMEIVPHVMGISFDPVQAAEIFAALQPAESAEVPLIVTAPEVTAERLQDRLFADVLGRSTSWISGSTARLNNVALAGSMCHDVILLPGDEFSFWNTIAPCNAEQGFQSDLTCLDGLAGGIGAGKDQVASAVYTCAFYANLEVLERSQHEYAASYLPDGCDAMIGANGPDLRFRNNTAYPIKIQVFCNERTLVVQILGSKTDDSYVYMESKYLSATEWEMQYKLDENVPVGKPMEVVSAFTGRQVEIYRCVYAGDGTLISRTLESKNDYKMRNPVTHINPADAYLYGLDEYGNPIKEA